MPPAAQCPHQELATIVRERLHQSPFAALRHLTCDVDGSVVTLRGRVHTYYARQMALAMALGAPGVEGVLDQLEVGLDGA